MGDKKVAKNGEVRGRLRMTIEEQLEVIKRFEGGERPARIAKDLGLPDTTVRCVIKRREKINKFKQINQAFGSSASVSQIKIRSSTIETMERLLVNWIENCNQSGVCLDMPMIQAKAREFFHKINNQQDFSEMSQTELKENFDASKGWFYRFKQRTGIVLQRSLNDQNGTVSKKTFASMKD